MKTNFASSFLLGILLLPLFQHATAQVDFSCQQIGSGCTLDENTMVSYCPDQYSPIITINLNFHFPQNPNETPENFTSTGDGLDPENTDWSGYDVAEYIVNGVNINGVDIKGMNDF